MPRRILAVAVTLSGCLPPAAAQTAILQVRVLEGEGAVHQAGTRTARVLSVQVTDEIGRPVEGVAVSFKLPDEGPTGTFANGLRSHLETTMTDGKASVWGLHWGAATGPVRIRVIAAKDQARAGTVVAQYVTEAKDARAPDRPVRIRRSRKVWWVALAAGAGGAAAAGLARGGGSKSDPAAVTAPPVQVGAPTISVGKP